jgi:hypothetical protein
MLKMRIHTYREIQQSIARIERRKRNEKIMRALLIVVSYLLALVIGLAI